MISEYKLRKNNEWKEVENDGQTYLVPNNWFVQKFSDFCSIMRGGSPRPIQQYMTDREDGIPWVKISDATSVKKFISHTEEKIKPEGEARSRTVYPGDLIISNSATPGIPRFMSIKACIHDGWLLVRDFNGVEKEFLFHLTNDVRESLKKKGSGSIFTNLSIEVLSEFEALIPTPSEQTKIANILSLQEEVISDLENLKTKQEKVLQYLMDELLSGRLRVKEVDGKISVYKNPEENWKEVEINGETVEIPKDWSVESVGKLAKIIGGGTPKTKNKEYWGGDIAWVTPTDISRLKTRFVETSEKKISRLGAETIKKKVLKKDDIIVTTRGTVGNLAIVKSQLYFNQSCEAVRAISCDPYFLYFILHSATSSMKKRSTGTTFSAITKETISAFEAAYPSLIEQNSISYLIGSQLDLIDGIKDEIHKEKTKLTYLSNELLSGRILVESTEELR